MWGGGGNGHSLSGNFGDAPCKNDTEKKMLWKCIEASKRKGMYLIFFWFKNDIQGSFKVKFINGIQ